MIAFTSAPAGDILLTLVQIVALLLTGRLLGEIASRLGQPPVIGELCAGIVLGPTLLSGLSPALGALFIPSTPTQGHLLEFAGLIAVLFLLLVTGMEVDGALIRRRLRPAIGISFGGLIVPLCAGFALGLLLPDSLLTRPDSRLAFAVYLGTAMTISAIPVLAKILLDLGLTRRAIGGTILVAAVVDDPIGWTLLAIVAALTSDGAFNGAGVARAIGGAALFMIMAFTIGRWAISAAHRLIVERMRARERELSLVVIVMIGGAAISLALGLEALLGAFVVGALFNMMRGGRTLSSQTRATLEQIAVGIAAPIFFGIIGLKVDARLLVAQPEWLWVTLLVIAVATVSKVAGVYLGARLFAGADHWTALFYGFGLNARGAMLLILAGLGVNLGVLNGGMFTVLVVTAIVTSIMAPPLLRLTLARLPADPESRSPHDATVEMEALTL